LDLIDWVERIDSMSIEELMEEGKRLIARIRALDNKERLKKLACQSRSKLIPKNAPFMYQTSIEGISSFSTQ
jgi:hypothetical protein